MLCTVALIIKSPAAPTFAVDASRPAGKVSPMLYGLMTEEINHSYDGGLYAELIRNRAFLDDTHSPVHWLAVDGEPGKGLVDVDWFRMALPAFITGIVLNSNSSMTLYFANSPGFTNIIQASTDLSTWQNVSTNIGDSNGFWQFTDANASLIPAQFYRSFTR